MRKDDLTNFKYRGQTMACARSKVWDITAIRHASLQAYVQVKQ